MLDILDNSDATLIIFCIDLRHTICSSRFLSLLNIGCKTNSILTHRSTIPSLSEYKSLQIDKVHYAAILSLDSHN